MVQFSISDENSAGNTVLVINEQHQGIFCFSLCSPSEEAEGAEEDERGHSQENGPQLTKHHRTSCSAVKAEWGNFVRAAITRELAGIGLLEEGD